MVGADIAGCVFSLAVNGEKVGEAVRVGKGVLVRKQARTKSDPQRMSPRLESVFQVRSKLVLAKAHHFHRQRARWRFSTLKLLLIEI